MSDALDSERGQRNARAFSARRWSKSRKDKGAWKGEVGSGAVTGLVGYLASPTSRIGDVAVGLTCGIAGSVIWHYILSPVIRYIWVVPVEEHVAQEERIHERDTMIKEMQAKLSKVEADVVVARDRQRLLDRLERDRTNGGMYLQMMERGEVLARIRPLIAKWESETATFISDQIGSDEWLRFYNANRPVTSKSPTYPTPRDHAEWAQRIRGQLEVLEALSRRFQQL